MQNALVAVLFLTILVQSLDERCVAMRIRKLDRIQEGAILYEDVIGERGECIFESGTIITNDRLRILKSLGIKTISICTQDNEIIHSNASLKASRKITSDMIFADSYTELLMHNKTLEYMRDDSVLMRHNKNVANLTAMCIDTHRMSMSCVRSIVRGAVLHDIGKMGIPSNILNKNGRLTKEEYEYIKLHPVLGVGYFVHRHDSNSSTELKIIEQHHENYDGSGYPYGLSGDEIDQNAALVHVIDVFEARCAKRTYKKPEDRTAVIVDMENDVGRMFSPSAFDIFKKSVPLYFVGERIVADDDYIYIVVGHTSDLEPILHNVTSDSEVLLSEVSKNHKCYVDDLHIKRSDKYGPLADLLT